MKHDPSNADSILRWRDRPEGVTSDEDRAAGLARDALAPGAFPLGLDDRQLLGVEERLKTEHRARPPFWLRPALVAALLIISAASVLGYETGWFAPVRERLRFRSIPRVAPEAVEPPKKRVARSRAAPDEQPPARDDNPPPELATDQSPPPQPLAAVAPRAPLEKNVNGSPIRKVSISDAAFPSARVVESAEARTASKEIHALERAVGLLRGKHDAPAALAALDDYIARFPTSALAPEARVARIDALLMLDRADDALKALDVLPFDAYRRSTELQLIRGELRARTDCGRATADFTAVLARIRTPALEERALYGRAACRSTLGDAPGATDDLHRYVDRFPNGPHADWARRWLRNNQ